MILHENFTSYIMHDNNDIALIKLKNVVEYDDHVQPICFPNKGKVYFLSTLELTTHLDISLTDTCKKRKGNTLFVIIQFISFENNRSKKNSFHFVLLIFMILIIIKEFNFDEFDSSSVNKKKEKEKSCFLTLIQIKKQKKKL